MSSYAIRNLSFSYATTPVLFEVTAAIQPGEFVALVGPNGAGKSTLLKVLTGLLRKHTGMVEFDGKPIAGYSAVALAKRVAYVPQETHVTFPFTVGEVIMMGRLPHRTGGLFETPRDIARAGEAMSLTDTTALADKTFGTLSGGERQRVILASALAQDPEVLLLDEPTVYLDLKHQIQFYDIVERLNVHRGMTVVSVTHDLNLAARYARRMIAIRAGRLIVDGVPEAVLTSDYLYEIFEITADVVRRPDGRGSVIIPTG